MPRSKTCRKCGRQYSGWRCPVCYPAKRKPVSSGRRSGGGSGKRRSAADVLGRSVAVNVDTLGAEATAAEAMKGGDPEDEGAASWSGEMPCGTAESAKTQQAQDQARGA